MTGHRRPVFDDAKLESPRNAYIMIGAGGTCAVSACIWMLTGWAASMPGWEYIIAGAAAVLGAAVLGAGVKDAREALEQRASMQPVRESLTAQFARIQGEGDRR